MLRHGGSENKKMKSRTRDGLLLVSLLLVTLVLCEAVVMLAKHLNRRISVENPPKVASMILSNTYAYTDGFGRLYFDTCPSPGAHMDAPTPPGEERRRCQKDVVELLPKESLNKKGKWCITIHFEED